MRLHLTPSPITEAKLLLALLYLAASLASGFRGPWPVLLAVALGLALWPVLKRAWPMAQQPAPATPRATEPWVAALRLH